MVRREEDQIQPESSTPTVIRFHPDEFNRNNRTSFHSKLLNILNKGLPGEFYETGPTFIAFVYEELKKAGKRTDFTTIILTAKLIANDPNYQLIIVENAPSANQEYLGRIRRYLDILQEHIEVHPEYYTEEFMTKIHSPKN